MARRLSDCVMTTSAALDVATLPEDPAALKSIIVDLFRRNQQLEHYLAQLRRWQFGSRSEKISEDQLIFGFAGKLESAPPKPEPEAPAAPKRKGHGRRPIPPELPREVTVHDVPESERGCPGCGAERAFIGHDETTRLEMTPPKLFQEVHLRAKYVCRGCRGHLVTAPGPAIVGPTERGLPGPGLLAHVVVSKFKDHLPLYRQEGIFGRYGGSIPRSTLSDWVGQSMELLAPVVAAMRKDVLSAPIIQTDDTVVRLLEFGKKRSRQARLWGYLGRRQVVFEFTPTRQQKWPQAFLKDFKGFVQCDAYKGYDQLFLEGSGRLELACWAHARRYFVEAQETDRERALAAIAFIRELYAAEEEAREMAPEARAALRKEKAAPVLARLRTWLEGESLRVLPKTPIGEALHYALAQWKALGRYVDLGEAQIDNNAMERALRGVAIGRKNYLHFASEDGGAWAAAAYSLIESCKLSSVEPWRYLKDVMMRVWTHPADRIAELMPRLWKPPPDSS